MGYFRTKHWKIYGIIVDYSGLCSSEEKVPKEKTTRWIFPVDVNPNMGCYCRLQWTLGIEWDPADFCGSNRLIAQHIGWWLSGDVCSHSGWSNPCQSHLLARSDKKVATLACNSATATVTLTVVCQSAKNTSWALYISTTGTNQTWLWQACYYSSACNHTSKILYTVFTISIDLFG